MNDPLVPRAPMHNHPSASRRLSSAAICCAVLGVITIYLVYTALIFGSLAVILALLSRGGASKIRGGSARIACILGIVSIALGIAVTTSSLVIVYRNYGGLESFYEQYLDSLEENTGINLTY